MKALPFSIVMVRVLIPGHQKVEFLNGKVRHMDGRSWPPLCHLDMKYSFNFLFNFLCDFIFLYCIQMYENCLK